MTPRHRDMTDETQEHATEIIQENTTTPPYAPSRLLFVTSLTAQPTAESSGERRETGLIRVFFQIYHNLQPQTLQEVTAAALHCCLLSCLQHVWPILMRRTPPWRSW
ncbi:hypothetical protein MHYP_G00107780 [Metynnis hypsauchen]